MLLCELLDDFCLFVFNVKCLVLVGYIEIDLVGNINKEVEFVLVWVESKVKLVYDYVLDYLEGVENVW